MDTHYLCPVCKKDNCFVCTYWNDDNVMDRLFAENGSLCYDHFDSIWLELLTHFFVWYGKTETTMEELCRTFRRNGYLPKGMESTLYEMEKERKIKINRKRNSNSWYSSIIALFNHEQTPEYIIIRCDFLLQEASRCINEIASGCGVNLFLLPCKETLLNFIHSNKEQLKDIDSSFYTIAEASQKVIEYEKCRPLDLKAQSKQFLRNLQNGEDAKFATFCCTHGIGSIFTIPGFSVFIMDRFNECTFHISKLPLLFRINSREKEYAILEEEFNTKSRELAREYKNGNQSSIRDRYKLLKQTFNRKRKRISNEIALLRKQLGIIQDAINAKTKYSKAVLKKMNLSLDDSMVNEYKEELDGTIEDIDDSIANKELDELVANDSPVPASGVLADSITFD